METKKIHNADSRAVVLLCSKLAFVGPAAPERPLAAREWDELARRIETRELSGPATLLGLSAGEVATQLDVTADEARRIAGLLDRYDVVAAELDRLAEMGVAVITRLDDGYPEKLEGSLRIQAPPLLFIAGAVDLLGLGGIAAVGSRSIDEAATAFAEEIGRKCARISTPLISGGARGTDATAMFAALESGGSAVGIVADSLERAIRASDVREALADGRLSLATPYNPASGFTIGAAMGRNKIIYGLADFAVVVSSDVEKGGTWAGATEAMKNGWCPIFVRAGEEVPKGNLALIDKGALPLLESELVDIEDLVGWMQTRQAQHQSGRPYQPALFASDME
jgi:DNA processing protein